MRKIVSAFDNEWTNDLLEEIYEKIESIAVGEMGYDIYPNQIEIISAEGMLEAYSTVGLPVMYTHWTFGKRYLSQSKIYKSGLMGLAYEIVINSDPCVSYLMEGNTLTMQTLVMAHACMGHNHFFKNNYLFKQWTQPEFILDYLGYAKRYILKCEEKYGYDKIEAVLDAAHSLDIYSVDKYNRRRKTKAQVEADLHKRIEWEDAHFDSLVSPFRERQKIVDEKKTELTENLLYFIEKQSPNLEDWEREIVRIVRKVGQYFYPQRQLQLMNEGFATATHAKIVHRMDELGLVDEAFMLEFVDKHSAVLGQQRVDPRDPNNPLRQLSPYKLGYEMFMDIKRRCENPTDEDKYYFPDQVGRPYMDVWFEAVSGFKDESFITQYLSPEVVRKMQLMCVLDTDKDERYYRVSGTTADESFEHVRKYLSNQYDLGYRTPQIAIYDVNWGSDRKLKLRHDMNSRRPLHESETKKVLRHLHYLWRFPVSMESFDNGNLTRTYNYP
jgi:stage V sporulation protein R